MKVSENVTNRIKENGYDYRQSMIYFVYNRLDLLWNNLTDFLYKNYYVMALGLNVILYQ